MQFPLVPYAYDPSPEELETYWKIDDLLGPIENISWGCHSFTMENEHEYKISVRMMNPYGGGVPTFYKGYLEFEESVPFFHEHTVLNELFSCPSPLLCLSSRKLSWGDAVIDFSRPLSLQTEDLWMSIDGIHGPRQIVQQAFDLLDEIFMMRQHMDV